MVYDYVEKADLGKGYQNPKRKLGANHAFFLEIIELKFAKKMPYILYILQLFKNGFISEKYMVTHIFLFRFQ